MVHIFVFCTLVSSPQPTSATVQHKSKAPVEASTKETFVPVEVAGVIPQRNRNTLILADRTHRRVIPIGIGDAAAMSIHLRMENRRYNRPLTHDLMDSMLERFGGQVVRVQIHHVRGEVFFGSVSVKRGDEVFTLDARPSDAIALALSHEVPVFVAESVLDQAGIAQADLAREQTKSRADEVILRL